MLQKIFFIFFCLFFCFCIHKAEKKAFLLTEIKEKNPIFLPPAIPYIITKKKVKKELKELVFSLKKNNAKRDYQALSIFFEKKMTEDIFPYWYETLWEFKGNTLTPQHGFIACGYLVATTLQDAGLKLNRKRIAQALPTDEALMLAYGYHSITIYNYAFLRNNTFDAMQQKLEDGLYFMAFPQTHVGFLWKTKGNLFLIHSGRTAGKTQIEHLENCTFLHKFRHFVILPLSKNPFLLDKWITST